jgi:hypothetical protein
MRSKNDRSLRRFSRDVPRSSTIVIVIFIIH